MPAVLYGSSGLPCRDQSTSYYARDYSASRRLDGPGMADASVRSLHISPVTLTLGARAEKVHQGVRLPNLNPSVCEVCPRRLLSTSLELATRLLGFAHRM